VVCARPQLSRDPLGGEGKELRRSLAAVALGLAATALYCGVSEYREREARVFCDSFVPLLTQYHAENGRYPEALLPEWYPVSGRPALIRPDFYLTFDDGQQFLMRFVNPQRPPFDNVVAYQSDIGHWASWDGY
jgi:hypothetical protein